MFDEIDDLSEDDLRIYVRDGLIPWIHESYFEVANLPDNHPDGVSIEDIVCAAEGEVPEIIKKLLEEVFGDKSKLVPISFP